MEDGEIETSDLRFVILYLPSSILVFTRYANP